jgi:ankyrin repeat protein
VKKKAFAIVLLMVVLATAIVYVRGNRRILPAVLRRDNIQVAAIKGDAERIASLLRRNPSLASDLTYKGFTPLHWASLNGHANVVKLLLASGAQTDARSQQGDTPLQLAAKKGHTEVAEMLLDAGADIDLANDDNETPLMFAAESGGVDMVKLLLDHGAAINNIDLRGETALYHAASRDWQALNLLLERGANPNLGSRRALEVAASESAHETENLLKRGAKPDYGRDCQSTALQGAAIWGQTAAVRLLLRHGARVNLPDYEGSTPLHQVADSYGWPPNCDVLGTAKLLLAYGARVNARNDKKQTPLDLAIERGHVQLIRLLLQHGAKGDPFYIALGEDDAPAITAILKKRPKMLEAKNKDGRTPMIMAAWANNSRAAAALVAAGANVNAADKDGNTALILACMEGCDAMVKMLLKHGASRAAGKSKDGFGYANSALDAAAGEDNIKTAQIILDAQKDPEKRRRGATLALWTAAMLGHPKMMDFLISNGADVNFRSTEGKTILQSNAGTGNGDDALAVIKVLLNHGADVNARDKNGNTALHEAALNPRAGALEYLLKHGANPNALDVGGQSPMDSAHDAETISLLLRNGCTKWKSE